MSTFDCGPLVAYQITWRNGHVETIYAHQVTFQGGPAALIAGLDVEERVLFHGQIDGHWRLILTARMADIATIRDLATEGLGSTS